MTNDRSTAETDSELRGVTDKCSHHHNNDADDKAVKKDPFVYHFSMMPLPEDTEADLAELKKQRGK